MSWTIISRQNLKSYEQMPFDDALATTGSPALRIFEWAKPAISLGRSQQAPSWLDCVSDLDVVNRPTGGGVAFHGSDVSLSLVVPRSVKIPLSSLMSAVGESIRMFCAYLGLDAKSIRDVKGSRAITYCLAEPSSYTILINESKVSGFALRRYKKSWLIQGSILVEDIPDQIMSLMPESIIANLREKSVSLSSACGIKLSTRDVSDVLTEKWQEWVDESLLNQFLCYEEKTFKTRYYEPYPIDLNKSEVLKFAHAV